MAQVRPGTLSSDEKLEIRQAIAEELARKAEEGKGFVNRSEELTSFLSSIAQRYGIHYKTARRFYLEAQENQALYLPVHEIIQDVVKQQNKLLGILAKDIESYEHDYQQAADAKDAGVYGGLKQKAITNANNILKSNIDLLSKVGGLSLASKKLRIEEEKLDQEQSSKEFQENLHYDDMSKTEIDRRMAELLQSGKHKALENEEIVDRNSIIND